MVRTTRLGIICLLALPAMAGAQSNTNCTTYGNTINCQTNETPQIDWGLINRPQQPPPPNAGDAFMRGYNDAQRRRADEEQRRMQGQLYQQELEQRRQEQSTAEMRRSDERSALLLREDVGRKLADGLCEEAVQTALRSGDIGLANEAKEYCVRK